jgi:transposase
VAKIKGRRRHSPEFKAAAVEKMRGTDSVVALSRELKVHWRLLYRWKAAAETAEAVRDDHAPEQREAALREEITKLKTALADKTMEVDFFRGALRNIETLRQKRAHNGGEASTTKSGT